MPSTKSEKFRQMVEEPSDEVVDMLVELERQARALVAFWDLTQSISTREIHGLARISKEIQRKYGRIDAESSIHTE